MGAPKRNKGSKPGWRSPLYKDGPMPTKLKTPAPPPLRPLAERSPALAFARRHHLGAHLMELAILAALMAALVYIYFPLRLDRFDIVGNLSVPLVTTLPLTLALLVLARLARRPLTFLLVAHAIVFGAGAAAVYGRWDVLQEIARMRTDYPELGRFWLPIPSDIITLRLLLLALVPFLIGIYIARRRFSIWKFAAGYAATSLALIWLLFPIEIPLKTRLSAPALLLGFSTITLLLPLQRRAFERLLGFPLTSTPVEAGPGCRQGFMTALAGHAALALIFAATLGMALLGQVERTALDVVQNGSPRPHRSPALRNAAADLIPLFNKQESATPNFDLDTLLPPSKGPRPYSLQDWLYSPLPPELARRVVAVYGQERLDARLAELNRYYEALGRANTADYCCFTVEGRRVVPHFVNLRIAGRALGSRALMNMTRNLPDEALADIDAIMKTGWLLHDDAGTLITYMIGTALHGIGLAAIENYTLHFSEDQAALERLAQWMISNGRQARAHFDLERLSQVEPGFWPVVPHFEVMVPGIRQPAIIFHARWARYDQLELVIALERHRLGKGHYPARLEALVPDFLARLRDDPFQGQPYKYELTEKGFKLACEQVFVGYRTDDIVTERPFALRQTQADQQFMQTLEAVEAALLERPL